MTIDGSTLTAIGTASALAIAALARGIALIIRTLRQTQNLLAAGTRAQLATGIVRDGKIQQIHLLVNSRLLTVLRLLVIVTKKEADRTNLPDDIRIFKDAESELLRSEAAASSSAAFGNSDSANAEADEAVKRISEMLDRFIARNP